MGRETGFHGLVKRAVCAARRDGDRQALVEACEAPPGGFSSDVYIRVRSDMKYVSPVRAIVDAVCAGGKLSQDDREDLKLAVGEAVCNAIEHGSPNAPQDYVCVACNVNRNCVTVSVSDSGGNFARKRSKCASGGLKERGYGLLLIKKLTSAVNIRSNAHGATVTLKKRCSAARA